MRDVSRAESQNRREAKPAFEGRQRRLLGQGFGDGGFGQGGHYFVAG